MKKSDYPQALLEVKRLQAKIDTSSNEVARQQYQGYLRELIREIKKYDKLHKKGH